MSIPAIDGAESRLIPRGWGQQHVVVAGSTDKPVIVLVHGWPQHWFAWRNVMPKLAATHRVIAIDVRGFGWSETDAETVADVSVRGLASDIVAVLDQLEVERAVLVGHDWGGIFGFRTVHEHPQRFSHLVALSIVPPWLAPLQLARHLPSWAYTVGLALAGDRIARSRGAITKLFELSTHDRTWMDAGGPLTSYLDRLAEPAASAMSRHLYAQLLTLEIPRWLGFQRAPRLTVPTTIVVGDRETITRPELYWSRTLPGELRVVTVPNARHWLPDEAPDAVVSAILRASGQQSNLEPAGEGPVANT